MDLTTFTNKKTESKEIILIENKDLKITKINDEYEFLAKTEKGLDIMQDYMFAGPTKSIITKDIEEANNFFIKSINDKVEGVMIKNLNSPYVSGQRTGAMAKLKEIQEDLDLVITGAEYGHGKRAGYYSSFIVSVKNGDEFLTIGKVASGITELENKEHNMTNLTNLLKPFKIKEEKNQIFFEPVIIIQVRYQEIQESKIYSSGYALRFPRIIMLRTDKSIDEINSLEDIKKFTLKWSH